MIPLPLRISQHSFSHTAEFCHPRTLCNICVAWGWIVRHFGVGKLRQKERVGVAILEASDSRVAGGSAGQGSSKGDKRKS